MRSTVLLLFVAFLFCIGMAGCGSYDDSSSEGSGHASDNSSDDDDHSSLETGDRAQDRSQRLAAVDQWFYYLDTGLSETDIDRMAGSEYDLLVIEPVFTEKGNEDFPISEVVSRLKGTDGERLVFAYIDIAQAENWRTYWQEDWEPGSPDWIIGDDPDGWENIYTVAFWRQEWQDIWMGPDGYLQQIYEADFDGIYLDWVEAYSDDQVREKAAADNIDARTEMIEWVSSMAAFYRAQSPDFLVIGQNASELVDSEQYLQVIDAMAIEQIWFDGGADNVPPGDCPLPATEADIDTEEYEASLSPACRRQYDEFPESTLHVSSEWYLSHLAEAKDQGELVFTVDYAVDPDNIAWVYKTSRGLGFIPFVGERGLSTYLDPYPVETATDDPPQNTD